MENGRSSVLENSISGELSERTLSTAKASGGSAWSLSGLIEGTIHVYNGDEEVELQYTCRKAKVSDGAAENDSDELQPNQGRSARNDHDNSPAFFHHLPPPVVRSLGMCEKAPGTLDMANEGSGGRGGRRGIARYSRRGSVRWNERRREHDG